MTDLFTWAETYPNSCGYKRPGTSEEAAASMRLASGPLRMACLACLLDRRGMTADEIAVEIGEDRLAVRPRLTELQALGLVKDSGDRRKNDSGRRAIVWVVA